MAETGQVDEQTPATFAELLNGGGASTPTCRRCGGTATHRARITVSDKALGTAGTGKTAATHSTDLCERCAVQLFSQVRKVMR